MIFDTDILIYVQRGNEKAADLINDTSERLISIQTYMELIQCAKNKIQIKYIRGFLSDFNFAILPFSQNIGHRAAIYVEQYTLSHSVRAADAIIAATAVEHNKKLSTSNHKHFRIIKELELNIFRP